MGVVQFLYSQGFSPDIISGTSVGSVNAIKLAEGEDANNPTQGLPGLVRLWLGLQTESDMYVETDALQKLGIDIGKDLKTFNLRQDGMISVTVDEIKNSVISSFVWPGPLGSIVTGILLSNVQGDISKWFSMVDSGQALFTLDPLEKRARSDATVLNLSNLEASSKRLFMATVSMDSGRLLFVDKSGQVFDSGNLKRSIGTVDVITGVFASAAAPVFYTPRVILSQTCVDGGIRALVPIKVTVDAGADTIYAVDCNAPPAPSQATTLTGIAFRSLDVMVDQVGEGNLEFCSPAGKPPRVFLVRPSFEVHDGLTVDPGLIRINMGYGFMRAFDDLDSIPTSIGRAYAKILSDDVASVRMKILAKERGLGEALFPNVQPPTPSSKFQKYVEELRRMKCELLWLLQRRLDIFGPASLPADYAQWPVAWTDPRDVVWGPTPWSALKAQIAHGDAKGGHSMGKTQVAQREAPCRVGIPLDSGLVSSGHMPLHDFPEPHFSIRGSWSGCLVQSSFGRQGNFELVVPQGERLIHYYRDNDDPLTPWELGEVAMPPPKPAQQGRMSMAVPISVQSGSLIQSSYRGLGKDGMMAPGDLAVVCRVSNPTIKGSTDSLSYALRDSVTLAWSSPVPVRAGGKAVEGLTGNPALIQSLFGGQGNFEVVVPQGDRLVHYWRDNDDPKHPWRKSGELISPTLSVARLGGMEYEFMSLPDIPIGVALIQNNFGDPGDFSLVARMRPRMVVSSGGDYLSYFRFDCAKHTWYGPYLVTCNGKEVDGVTGSPALIQSAWGQRGNFELLVPRGDRLVHYTRDNDATGGKDDPKAPWAEVADLMNLPQQVFPMSVGPSLKTGIIGGASPVSVSLTTSTLGRWGSMCAVVRMRPQVDGEDFLATYSYEPTMECSSTSAFLPAEAYWKGPTSVKLPHDISDPLMGSL